MARPKKARRLQGLPEPVLYRPVGAVNASMIPMEVTLEDFEVMRLVDGRGYTIEEAAARVGVSRSTAGRMLQRCRRTLAQGLEERAPICLDAGSDLKMEADGMSGHDETVRSCSGMLAIACHECTEQSAVSRIFGRAPGFVLVSDDGKTIERIANPGYRARRDAAGKATRLLSRLGVKLVIAGKFGDEAIRQLNECGIRTQVASGLSVYQALEFFTMRELKNEYK